MKIGIVTDIHEDVISLQKAIKRFENNNCDEIICLGDIIGYTKPFYNYDKERNGSECINILRKNCKSILIGNHDLNAIKKTPEHSSFYKYPANWFDFSFNQKLKKSKKKIWLYEGEIPSNITKNDKEFLATQPEFLFDEYVNAFKICYSHYIFPDFTGSSRFFPYFKFELSKYFKFLQKHNINIGIFGHLHPRGILIAKKTKFDFFSYFKYPLECYNKEEIFIDDNVKCICVPATSAGGNVNYSVIFNISEKTIILEKL